MTNRTFPVTLAFEEITEELDAIVGRRVHKLYADLIDVGERVHDTRNFKHSFVAPERTGKHSWRIRNTADYAVVLAQGRHKINGKAYGSLKWYHGLAPMLYKLKADITNEFNRVKK